MTPLRWRLVRGPWDGRVVEALPGRELHIPVLTAERRLLSVVYTAESVTEGVITATFEGHIDRNVHV